MKSTRKTRRFIALLLVFSLIFSLNITFSVSSEGSNVQGGQSNIINGSFEDPSYDETSASYSSKYKYEKQDNVSGWNTTATTKEIEIGWMVDGQSAHMTQYTEATITSGVGASDGMQFAEVVGNEVSSLFQSIAVHPENTYSWMIHHRGRTGSDTLALIITDDAGIEYVKPQKSSTDLFQQIVTWLKNNGITAPASGEKAKYTVYTTPLVDSTSFDGDSANWFSFTNDTEHTVKFEVYLMCSDKENWSEYTGEYTPDQDKNILFVLTPFATSFKSNSGGNLIDQLSFGRNGNNFLVNPSFDSVTITTSYKNLTAANAPSPTKGIGWSTTASDYVVEVGNISKGDAYGLGAVVENVAYPPVIRDGKQFAELNAGEESSLYQIIDTNPGKMYKWSLSHRGRSGTDTMALILGPNQEYDPKKTDKKARDQLMQIVDWMLVQRNVPIEISENSCSQEYKVYTPKFDSNGAWATDENIEEIFTWQKDETHTEEWSVWIISSDNRTWYDYGEIDAYSDYNYNYIVPKNQDKTIFGFVSVSAVNGNKEDKTYGNLLDNIAFKEYYYSKIEIAMCEGSANENAYFTAIPDDAFVPMTEGRNDEGWTLRGSDLTVHIKPLAGRELIGAYINGAFVLLTDPGWVYDPETGEYTYTLNNVEEKTLVTVIFKANKVYYDANGGDEYQYDNISSGPEVPMAPEARREYISHEPTAGDGYRFVGWNYIDIATGETHTFDATHKVILVQDSSGGEDSYSFRIQRILEDNSTQDVITGISYEEGITFIAEWKYRQRVLPETYDKTTKQYVRNEIGGTVDIRAVFGTADEKTDYGVGGKELYASSDDTYISVTAQKNYGYTFNGWYNQDGVLVSRNTNYTYKVDKGGVMELYARFDPSGLKLTLNTTVVGYDDQYFAIECYFSGLLKANYFIDGLSTNSITINGSTVTNPTMLTLDPVSGTAQAILYMKDGDSAIFLDLPEGCVYTLKTDSDTQNGFHVNGEVLDQTLDRNSVVDLLYFKATQSVKIKEGKHYAGIAEEQQEILITEHSSYTFQADTYYAPTLYSGLTASLCFHQPDETALLAFADGSRILMIDITNPSLPAYYSYTVGSATSVIPLTDFIALGTADVHFALHTAEENTMLMEKLVFVVDYVDVAAIPASGTLTLAYENSASENILDSAKIAVNIGDDNTDVTAAAVDAYAPCCGPFRTSITITPCSPAVNTTYEGDAYAIKLTLDGGRLPDASYAVLDGTKFFSINGEIRITPMDAGTFTLELYTPVPLAAGSVAIQATLLPAITNSPSIPVAHDATAVFTCADYAIDADVIDKVLTAGVISESEVTLEHRGLDNVKLIISEKNGAVLLRDVDVSIPTNGDTVIVDLKDGLIAEAGKTYTFTFIGYVGDAAVCSDVCCVVGGYL